MPDGTIGFALVPPVSLKFVDTNLTVNDAGTAVHRQNEEDPELLATLRSLVGFVQALASTVRSNAVAGNPAVGFTTASENVPVSVWSVVNSTPVALVPRMYGTGGAITVPAYSGFAGFHTGGIANPAGCPSYLFNNFKAMGLRRKIVVT